MPRDSEKAIPPRGLEETRAKTTQTEGKHANQRKLSDRRRSQGEGWLVWRSEGTMVGGVEVGAGRRGGTMESVEVGADSKGAGVLW